MSSGQKLRGLVGQGMNTKKSVALSFIGALDSAAGAVSFTAKTDCFVFAYAYGAGGSGALNAGHNGGGGAGGAAGFKRLRLAAGQVISWIAGAAGTANTTNSTNGNDGADTIVTSPSFTLVAGGGKGGQESSGSALGGVPSGPWDLARTGGIGGATGGFPGGSPAGGGTGGAGSGSMGGGGGCAGFSDLLLVGTPAISGSGGAAAPGGGGAAGGFPGGGSGCSDVSPTGAGGAGRVLVYIFKIVV
jgi:hypothetical protein